MIDGLAISIENNLISQLFHFFSLTLSANLYDCIKMLQVKL